MRKLASLTKKQKICLILALIFFVIIWFVVGIVIGKKIAYASKDKLNIGSLINKSIEPEKADYSNPINGIWYTQKESDIWKKRLPIGVIIENHLEARPQSGLSRADVVYETLAEGGITRLLAVFLSTDSKVGPVRSNRPYFLDWVSEYGAGYAHVGGSPLAQGLISKYSIKDLDQFYLGSPTYERVSSRYAPHNVYSTTSKLRNSALAKGYKGPVVIESWKFADEEIVISHRPKTFNINLGFLGAYDYRVKWVYDKKTNNFLRFNGGSIHKDEQNKKQISSKNIIVQYVSVKPEGSGHSRILLGTIGKGKAVVFKDGKAFVGTWSKKNRKSRTKFFDKKGKEIYLNRGKIWVEVVPKESEVTFK